MKVRIHTLFQYLLETTDAAPEAIIGFSLSEPPKLSAILDDLDPDLALDWNGRSFQGLPALRERIIDQAGLALSPDCVLVTAGAAEANYLTLMQLLQPGDEIVVERPGWPQAEVIARAKDIPIRHVDRVEADGWSLPLDALEEAVTTKTKLIFLTNPNNPTGALLSEANLNRIAAIADRVGAWLLVDEVYAGLEWSAPRAPSIAGLYPRGITTGSVSKALGAQGLRTGWLITQDADLLRDALILRENSSEIMNILGEHAAEILLRANRLGPAMEAARAAGRANLDRLTTALARIPGLTWTPPAAGLIGLARLPDGIDSDTLARRLLAAPYRTFLLPGSAYGLPQHIRVGVGGGPDVALEEGLDRLAACLKEMTT